MLMISFRHTIRRLPWPAVLILLAAAFVFTTGVSLSLVRETVVTWRYLGIVIYWLGITVAGYFVLYRFRPGVDPLLYPIATFLMGWGLWLVDRLAGNFLPRQMIWIGLGIVVMVGATLLPARLRTLRLFPYTWLLGGLLLVGATLLFGVNPSGGGARLWLKIPFIEVYFQPSELLKLLLLVFLASYFGQKEQLLAVVRKKGRWGPVPYLAPLLLMWGFCIGLLVWQRDLGAAALFFLVFLAMFYLATGELLYTAAGFGMLLLAAIFGYFTFDLVALRVNAWVNPWPDAADRAFQIVQSLYALGAGGIFGEGIGQGFPQYIPVVHSDFAFAGLVEEWGMIGAFTVIICFGTITFRAFRIAMLAHWPCDMYLA